MAQKYLIVNLTKREKMDDVLPPDSFGIGYLEAQTMLEHWNYIAMKPLLASSLFGFGLHCGVHTGDLQAVGRWVWNRIVIIGEQSSGPLPFLTAPENDELKKKNKTLYSLASDEYQEVATGVISWMRRHDEHVQCKHKIFDAAPKTIEIVFANLDRKQYVDPQQFGYRNASHIFGNSLEANAVMTLLYALLFYTNEIGEGDPPEFQIGRWAGCRLEIMFITTARLWKYTDISAEVMSQLRQAES